MTTTYPASLDTFVNPIATDALNSGTVPHTSQHDNLNDAVLAIETALGLNPKGSFASVVARLNSLPWTSSAIAASITLVARTQYFVTTSSAWTLTLPATPTQGDEIRIFDASGSAATNNITVAPNGSNLQGSIQNLVLAYAFVSVTLIYTGATYGWKVA